MPLIRVVYAMSDIQHEIQWWWWWWQLFIELRNTWINLPYVWCGIFRCFPWNKSICGLSRWSFGSSLFFFVSIGFNLFTDVLKSNMFWNRKTPWKHKRNSHPSANKSALEDIGHVAIFDNCRLLALNPHYGMHMNSQTDQAFTNPNGWGVSKEMCSFSVSQVQETHKWHGGFLK